MTVVMAVNKHAYTCTNTPPHTHTHTNTHTHTLINIAKQKEGVPDIA